MVKLCKSHIQNRGSEFGHYLGVAVAFGKTWRHRLEGCRGGSRPTRGQDAGATRTATEPPDSMGRPRPVALARDGVGQPITPVCDSDHRVRVMGEIPSGPRRSG